MPVHVNEGPHEDMRPGEYACVYAYVYVCVYAEGPDEDRRRVLSVNEGEEACSCERGAALGQEARC